ncbi:hypothetical protein DPMN_132278 [Dreissena polymorpha]|uniref:Uncharacterized protein n=1 Tax=Dreissena polymorpha TaxID=45954 RepID=A0A9D4J9Y4_DREPO|nr:hypothetical protein DPMN_132278 [Dreissena polymorpha]
MATIAPMERFPSLDTVSARVVCEMETIAPVERVPSLDTVSARVVSAGIKTSTTCSLRIVSES